MFSLFSIACQSQGGYVSDLAVDLGVSLPDLSMGGPTDAAVDQAVPGCPARTLPISGGCVPCSVLVPDDQPTISLAISAAPKFGTVC